MWDIPGWLVTMNSMKPLLTGTGTFFVYLALAASVASQIGVFFFGAYKIWEMIAQAED